MSSLYFSTKSFMELLSKIASLPTPLFSFSECKSTDFFIPRQIFSEIFFIFFLHISAYLSSSGCFSSNYEDSKNLVFSVHFVPKSSMLPHFSLKSSTQRLLKLAGKLSRACTHAFTHIIRSFLLQTIHRKAHISKSQLLTGCIVDPENYTPTLHRDFSWFWLTAFSAKIRFWLTVFWNSWPFPKKVDLCGQIGFSIDWRAAVKGWCIVGV